MDTIYSKPDPEETPTEGDPVSQDPVKPGH